MLIYTKFNKDGEPIRPAVITTIWTDKELYEDLPRQLKALRDGQYKVTRKSRKITGISWQTSRELWVVKVTFNGVQEYIGTYKDYETAAYHKVKAIKERKTQC